MERYFAAETTVQEERLLREFFSQDEVPSHLQQWQSLFVAEKALAEAHLDEEFDRRLLQLTGAEHVAARRITLGSRLRPLFKAAAFVAFAIVIGTAVEQASTYHQPADEVLQASFEGDDTHYPGNASYTLTVTSKGDSPELAFDREGMVVTKGKAVTAPKLTIPESLTATYSTSNNKVASVNATTGALTINGVGTATITATTPATLQYATASAVYYIMVVSNAEKIRCDANNDGNVSITDAVTVVNYILGE